MNNPIYLLFGLLIAGAYPLGIEPLAFAQHPVAPWAFLGALLVYGGISWAVLGSSLGEHGLTQLILRALALVLYAELIFVFHLPFWIEESGVEDPMAATLLILAPLWAFYGVLALVHARLDPAGGGLRFAFRGFVGMSLLPLLLLLSIAELFERVEVLRRFQSVYPAAGMLAALGAVGILLVYFPPLLGRILGARPMPPGDLRGRLEQRCADVGFRAAELLVVPTGASRVANAFVVGFSARRRYVFFTEAILDGMSPRHLECVLLHEVTHAQKRHILTFIGLMSSLSVFTLLAQDAIEKSGISPPALAPGMVAWSMLWLLAFGFVSRRFEMEADLVAARVAPPSENGLVPYAAARGMASALQRVADLNHVPVDAWAWRHFTIERRIEILVGTEQDPSLGQGFERVCDRIRTVASGMFLAALLCGGVLLGLQVGKAPENRALYEAREAVERGRLELAAGRHEEARRDLRSGINAGADSAAAQVWLADCERALGREAEARKAEDQARKMGVADPRLRIRLGEGTSNR